MEDRAIGLAIRKLREERGLTLRDLEKRTGMSNSLLSKKERGVLRTRLPEQRAIAKALGVSWPAFQRAVRDCARTLQRRDRGIPVLGTVPGSAINMHWQLWDDPEAAEEWLDRGGLKHRNAFALRVVGDSMEPVCPAGSIVICVPFAPDLDHLNIPAGHLVVVSFGDDAATPGVALGYWTPREDGRVMLTKANWQQYDPIELRLNADPPEIVQLAAVVERRIREPLAELG